MTEKYVAKKEGDETAPNNDWAELEKGGTEKKLSSPEDNSNQANVSQSPEEKQEKVAQALNRVKEAYRSDAAEKPKTTEISVESEIPSKQRSSSLSIRTLITSKYETAERSRIERLKQELKSSFFKSSEFERKQIAIRPNTFKKAIRLVTDKLGIKTKRSEDRREREAMHIALLEYREEKAARAKELEERQRHEAAEKAKKEAEYQAEQARREQEAIARDMSEARGILDYHKHERIKKQRIQEIVERDLNTRLLKVEDLEIESVSDNPEVQQRHLPFEDSDITVYDLKGLPFCMLSTTIDYRKANEEVGGKGVFSIGLDTYHSVMENPAVWSERRDIAESKRGFGTRNRDARGDTISTSYYNSERNIVSHVSGDLIYGFEKVEADSIISISNGDGATSNMAGKSETVLSSTNEIANLEGANGTTSYNEILLRRYSETGIPKKPDYIITENGRITETALRHAKFFGIPIVNIERQVYAEKAQKRGEEILESISEKDSYQELDRKIAELMSISTFKINSGYLELEGIGRDYDKPRQLNPTPLQERCLEVSKMEQLKRLEFVKSTLEGVIRNIESTTERGLPASENLPGFEYFRIFIVDVQKQLWRTDISDRKDTSFSAPGNCNYIDMKFRLKGSTRNVKTRVYDGKRLYKAQEAFARGGRTREDVEKADSSYYDALEPVVLRYFEALRKNREQVSARR